MKVRFLPRQPKNSCGGSLAVRHFVANEDHAGSIPVRRSNIPAHSSTVEQPLDKRQTQERHLLRRPNFLPISPGKGSPQRQPDMVVEGKETSPPAVTRSLAGASPVDHPKIRWYNQSEMPHLEKSDSWRINPRWRFVSRAFCFFGKHFWLMSRTLEKPIACAVCEKKTKHMAEYKQRSQL